MNHKNDQLQISIQLQKNNNNQFQIKRKSICCSCQCLKLKIKLCMYHYICLDICTDGQVNTRWETDHLRLSVVSVFRLHFSFRLQTDKHTDTRDFLAGVGKLGVDAKRGVEKPLSAPLYFLSSRSSTRGNVGRTETRANGKTILRAYLSPKFDCDVRK